METIKFIFTSALVAFFCVSTTSQAEDTDIYSNVGGTGNIPNLMFVVDSSANSDGTFGTCNYDLYALGDGLGGTPTNTTKTLGNEQCAMANIVRALSTRSDGTALINLGITTADGVYFKLTPIDDKTYTGATTLPNGVVISAGSSNRQAFIAAAKGLTKRTSGVVQGDEMQETWAYYTGGDGGTTGTGLLSGVAFPGTNATTGCQRNYAAFLGTSDTNSHAGDNGGNGGVSPSTSALNTSVDNAFNLQLITAAQQTTFKSSITNGATPDKYVTPAKTTSDSNAREWARFMANYDSTASTNGTGLRNIVTYTVAIGGSNVDMQNFISDLATFSGGKAFNASTYADIVDSILKILNEVQSVNSVFSSSTLPVSVNTQGTYLNQVFMGMFRPDGSGNPRWVGNLKQYQFVYTSSTQSLSLGDSNGTLAISSSKTGFISSNAVSFWTCGGSTTLTSGATNPNYRACSPVADPTGGFWIKQPSGSGTVYDSPDGQIVEKGGAAQQIRLANLTDDYTTAAGTSTNPRKLYTYCPSGSSCVNSLSDTTNVFNTSNAAITDAMLGTGSRTISSITSAPTAPTSTSVSAGATGAAASITITGWAESQKTVTATVSSTDIAILSVGTQMKITTNVSQYNCDPCTVTTVNASTAPYTFTYSVKSNTNLTPTSNYVANLYTNFIQVTTPQPQSISVGQTVTFSSCSVFTTLNNTIGTVTNVTAGTPFSFTVGTSVSVSGGPDTGCNYTPNTATVTTTSSHGFNTGDTIQIASAVPTGYNSSWTITVTGDNSFTFQYTSAAPLANCAAGSCSATATNNSSTRDLLLKWVRGQDNAGDEAGPGGTVTVRPSIHGDVLHSRPIVINYGGTTGVIAFYGANDGVFRAVNGNQKSNPTGSTLPAPGNELWGFIPTEFYGKLNRLRANSPQLSLPSTPSGIVPTPRKKDYFIDGPTGVYQVINSSGVTTSANIYLSMRRGGRFIYALQVNDPTNPQFLWKASNTSTDFAELGQTWSEPKVAFVKGYDDGTSQHVLKPVLIFGAGYDPNEDNEPPTADTMGRGIFIVDAATGAMIWSARHSCSGITSTCVAPIGMDFAIPADITLVDKNADGVIDRLYATDTGGNVWRVDLEKSATQYAPANWQVEKLAALGCDTGVCASGTTPRKFFYKADVIPTSTFDAVLVGSGDREHPLAVNAANSVTNRVYMLKDPATGNDGSGTATITQSPTTVTGVGLVDETNATATSNYSNATDKRQGYFITLGAGEKVVNAPSTAAGSTFFGTNQPTSSSNSCVGNLGIAKGYTLSPLTGTTTYVLFSGGGLPPTPVYGFVNITVTNADGTTSLKLVPFIIGAGNSDPACTTADCTSSIGSIKPSINVSQSRSRTYWYIEKDQ